MLRFPDQELSDKYRKMRKRRAAELTQANTMLIMDLEVKVEKLQERDRKRYALAEVIAKNARIIHDAATRKDAEIKVRSSSCQKSVLVI